MRKISLVVALTTLSYSEEWITQFGTGYKDYANSITTDPSGNIIIAGDTAGSIESHFNSGDTDLLLVKYNASGIKQWGAQFGSKNADSVRSVVTDSSGNIYITGETTGFLADSYGFTDFYIAKYNSSGVKQWIKQFGTEGNDYATGIKIDKNGQIVVVGYSNGSLATTKTTSNDVFVAKYNSNGEVIWLKQFGSISDSTDMGLAVATDSLGNILITGKTDGPLNGANNGENDIWLAKYDTNGNRIWIQQFGSSANDLANAIAVDSKDNIFLTGNTNGVLNGSNSGDSDVWLSKYDTTGNPVWIKQFGTISTDIANGINVDSLGNIYISGSTKGALSGTNYGMTDLFVSKYDSFGNRVWLKQLGGSGDDVSQAVTTDTFKNIYVSGFTNGSIENASSSGNFDMFLKRIEGRVSLDRNETLPYDDINCLYGGTKIYYGLDSNGDGNLSNDEVTSEAFNCLPYPNVIDVNETLLQGNVRCFYGGIKMTSGLDKNRNNLLDSYEINSTYFECYETPISLVKTEILNVNSSCLNGGVVIKSGLDLNYDSILQDSEMTNSINICNGTNGSNGTNGTNGNNGTNGSTSLIKTTAISEDNNETNCSNGGTKIETGLDLNSNGILDLNEISASQEICLAAEPLSEIISEEIVSGIVLKTGWSLIAIDKNLTNISNQISIIWQFAEGNWSAYSPSGEYSTAIVSAGYKTIANKLSSKVGTWFLAKSDLNISNEPVRDQLGNLSPTFPNLAGKLGWNLMGTDRTLPAKALYCLEGSKNLVWKYKNNVWLLFIDGVEITQYPNIFQKLDAGQGFWLHCK